MDWLYTIWTVFSQLDPGQKVAVAAAIAGLTLLWTIFWNIYTLRKKSRAPNDTAPDNRSSDLRISDLDDHRRLIPLDGHVVHENVDGLGTVYTGGCKVEFELSHNGDGNDPITLRVMRPEIVSFEPGPQPALGYKIVGEQLSAAGTAKVHEFRVSIMDGELQQAKWIIDPFSGRYEMAQSADNMLEARAFDKAGSDIFQFAPDPSDVNTIKGSVLVYGQGLCGFRFHFVYSIGGREHEHHTQIIWVYTEE